MHKKTLSTYLQNVTKITAGWKKVRTVVVGESGNEGQMWFCGSAYH